MPKSVLAHANSIAPEPFLPPTNQEPRLYQITTELLCLMCTQLIVSQATTGHYNWCVVQLFCLRCCVSWVQFLHPPLTCPCCYNSAHLRPPPTLEGLLVNCEGVWKSSKSGSVPTTPRWVMPESLPSGDGLTNKKDVLSRPYTSPAEVKVTEHLVKKIIDQGSSSTLSDGVFTIPTRGQVSYTKPNHSNHW